ncbi:MAG: PASTA domain-containing protein [Candidatus Marinimicrobia bacterium]|nr:PASTA domain-containing protein [Candidatus Neomarinimicrobiota bacterium]
MTVRMRNWIRFLTVFMIFSIIFVLIIDKIVLPTYVGHDKEIPLVDVRGRSLDETAIILDMLGLHYEVIDSTENNDLPPQTVVDQQPPAGTLVKTDRVLRLVITSGERFFPMPNLVGKVIKAANLELQRYYLKTDSISYEFSSDKPRGVITAQSIRARQMISASDSVSLVVSKGPPPRQLEVPDLFGLNLDEAKAAIRKAGFRVGAIRYITNDDLVAYTVIGQKPEFGVLYDNAVPISLEVTIASHSGD